jgi:hypothetical protein
MALNRLLLLRRKGHQSLVTGGGLNWAALYAYSQGAFRSLRR